MHTTSYLKMESFFRAYGDQFPRGPAGKVEVLEVGSKSYEGQDSYRSLIDDSVQHYVGLDLEAGLNVDIVPAVPFVWPEIADDSFDVCISGQTFEHNPFFWATAAEMVRVLRPGGFLCITAPGSGPVHRYPMDCWRFYPDSWSSLCHLVGIDLLETYYEPDSLAPRLDDWGAWRDTMFIARKPAADSPGAAEAAERRAQLIAPFQNGFGNFESVSHRVGPAFSDYLERVPLSKPKWPLLNLRKRVSQALYSTDMRYDIRIYEPSEEEKAGVARP